jgi:hypothetical protein
MMIVDSTTIFSFFKRQIFLNLTNKIPLKIIYFKLKCYILYNSWFHDKSINIIFRSQWCVCVGVCYVWTFQFNGIDLIVPYFYVISL